MNGNKILVDTNILLYYLNGDKTLANMLDKRHIYVSFISELELLSYSSITKKDTKAIKALLEDCTIININESVKKTAILLRINYQVKLPDAIIMATANYLDLPIITADTDFKKVQEISLLFYEYKNS